MEELKKCPFCGGKAQVYVSDQNIFGRIEKCYSVYCQDCCSTTQYESSKEEAIKDWNRRCCD